MTEVIFPKGFEFDAFSLGVHDWNFIADYLTKQPKRLDLLEVGSGLSSLLLSQIANVTTIENDNEWVDKVCGAMKPYHSLSVLKWDGVNFPLEAERKWDAVFLDGADAKIGDGRKNIDIRQFAFAATKNLTDTIFVHDAAAPVVAIYEMGHLAQKFNLTAFIKSDEWPTNRYMALWERRYE